MKKTLTKKFIIYYAFITVWTITMSILSIRLGYPAEPDDYLSNISNFEAILLYIFGAFVETFLFSFMLILFLNEINYLKNNYIMMSVIAAIPFGLFHWQSLPAIFISFVAGISFNLFYLESYKLLNKYRKSILLTSLLHFMVNISIHTVEKITL